MKCLVPRCRDGARDPEEVQQAEARWASPRRKPPAPIPLCKPHRKRFLKAEDKRFHGKSHFGDEHQYATWVATWLQMVSEEMLAEEKPPDEPVKSAVAEYTAKHALPEQATKAGQAAIALRDKEQLGLEAQLEHDVAEYRKGRKMELEFELRTKRAARALEERGVKSA